MTTTSKPTELTNNNNTNTQAQDKTIFQRNVFLTQMRQLLITKS
jgi:hypothetical protein